VTGTIYRYVTYRAQSCPLVNASVATQIATSIGQAQADVAAAVGNLCSGTSQTKRITIVVRSNDVVKYGAPVRLSTVATDPSASVLAASGYDGLRVNAQPVVNTATSSNPTPESAYADVTSQALYLTDTRCTSSSRQAPGSGHSSHDTSQTFPVGTNRCATTATAADLMPLTPPSGLLTAPLPDLSTEVSRPAVGGLVLARDDHAGSCTAQVNYAAAEADRRRRSIHTWASKSPGGNYETAVTAGRATLNFWTQTASAQTLPGRMCVTVWRAGTGQILGSADYQLPAWPAEPTQLAIAFDLAHAVIPSGERLMMTLRTPQDSGADLLLLYDHAGYPSSLSIPTRVGSALS
jgi:hypothetical protein